MHLNEMSLVKMTEIHVTHESTEQKQPIEAEYSSDDDVASPELDLEKKTELDDDELLSEEDEEEEESSEGNDYDTESSVDDSDLLKRLEEKYGKLPQPHRSDAKDNDDVDDDDDDNDGYGQWTSTYSLKNTINQSIEKKKSNKTKTNPNIPNSE